MTRGDVGTTGLQAATESEQLVTYVTYNTLTACDVTGKHAVPSVSACPPTAVTRAEELVNFVGPSSVCTKQ